jgi:hypothetical protein
MTSWKARLVLLGLAGLCVTWLGCGRSDVPDPDSDSKAAPVTGLAKAPERARGGRCTGPSSTGRRGPGTGTRQGGGRTGADSASRRGQCRTASGRGRQAVGAARR